MRNASAAAAVAAATLALALSGLGAGGSSPHRASLRLITTIPLKVGGAHFRSRERVRVVVTVSDATRARAIRASGKGSFVTEFPIGAGRCDAVRVVAVGNAGSRTVLKHLPAPACLPV
jgi:hypothetical protein